MMRHRGEQAHGALGRFLRQAVATPTMEDGALWWHLEAPKDDLVATHAVIAWDALQ